MSPFDLLVVGERWGDLALRDQLVTVHRVDPVGGRVMLSWGPPPPGKRWAVNAVLKRGMPAKIRRTLMVDGVRQWQSIEGTVLSAGHSTVTLGDLRYGEYGGAS